MQSRAERITMRDMPSGVTISLNEEYENGKKALNHLDRLLCGILTPKERKELGIKKLNLASRQCELKKKLGKYKPKHSPHDKAKNLTRAMSLLLPQAQVQEIIKMAESFRENINGITP